MLVLDGFEPPFPPSERRRCAAPHDGWCSMDQLVVLQRGHHEQREVHPPGQVALEQGISDVVAPHRQALARAFFEVASANDGPPRVAGEDALTVLTAVFLQQMYGDTLPDTGYMVLMDKIYLLCYALISLVMLQIIIAGNGLMKNISDREIVQQEKRLAMLYFAIFVMGVVVMVLF